MRPFRRPAIAVQPSYAHPRLQSRSVSVIHTDPLPASHVQSPLSPLSERSEDIPPPPPPPVTTTPAAAHATVDDLISSLPLVQSLRRNKAYTESRPHLTMASTLKATHFVAGALTSTGKVSVPPYMFSTKHSSPSSPSSVISIFHVGAHLCGHPGYVHGGLLTVLFDEVFARCVSACFPSGLGMTANLNVDFRKPATPDRVYVLRASVTKVEGRKAWVQGTMDCLVGGITGEGVMVAEAKALFVEPKFAESMVPLYKA
ncbi:hypothetical protein ASPZODRAFT_69704 [Penicilliopsis zonata CBS 506.65]|uniref:Thioesterase domain-containing protein n=1 Tax=Penicilliopsis zonata CBS 506.65 TaxID=1073090 RepID=A0A1L9SDT5_9EURO|nr:hypothetical protein ASPZODRAFT_69704 [Penicilliopsis zonata CBS 506.65]OJJ45341.1 hypothetical protein ASPZODRAFT_69704 [Penicilliopsis zonata CBS 506.65]